MSDTNKLEKQIEELAMLISDMIEDIETVENTTGDILYGDRCGRCFSLIHNEWCIYCD